MNTELRIFTRRIDGAWRVTVLDRDEHLEHTHEKPFTDRRDAYRLADEIEVALDGGRHLNLAHWTTDVRAI